MAEAALMVAIFAPLVLVIWMANVAERRKEDGQPGRGEAAVAIGLLALFFGVLALIGLAITLDAAVAYPEPGPVLGAAFAPMGGIASEMILGLGFLVPSLIGLALLFIRIPDGLARALGMSLRRDNVVHAVAVSLTMLVFVNLVTTLGFGLSNLATSTVESGQGASLAGIWAQNVLSVVLAVVGVGWPVRRDIAATLERLGLTAISLRQVGVGLGLGVALAPLVMAVVLAAVAVGIEPDAEVEALNEALLGPLIGTPLGIFTIGFAAGIGEEVLLRGALQPRFGLWATAALFAVLHSNYGLSMSTLVVFVLGIALGLARIRYNTTTTILMHAAYNITLSVLSTFASSYIEP